MNKWSFADYPEMPNGRFDVPNNRWGGNSAENIAYEPRKEKSPTDLRYFSKFSSSTFKAPGKEGKFKLIKFFGIIIIFSGIIPKKCRFCKNQVFL